MVLEYFAGMFWHTLGDYARPHKTYLVDFFLQIDDIRQMNWRSEAAVFIPKTMCGTVNSAVTCKSPPKTIYGLKTAVLNEWYQLPKELINCLIFYEIMVRELYFCNSGP